ncbi:MAG: hypothetical protein NUW22_15910 [Acidobacteria bacterium]|nr:hypothetical protein [Acidobacteriota bacterium]
MRLLLASALLLATMGTVQAEQDVHWTSQDTHAAIDQVDPQYRAWVDAIVRCESSYEPYATAPNDGGYGPSRGAVQINDYFQGAHFRAQGFADPYNPYEAVAYLAAALGGDYVTDGIGWWRWSCA